MHKIIRDYEMHLEKVDLGKKTDAAAKLFDFTGDKSFGAGILEVRGGAYQLDSAEWDEVLYVIDGSITFIEDSIEKVATKGDIVWTSRGTKSEVIVKDYLKAFYVIRPFTI